MNLRRWSLRIGGALAALLLALSVFHVVVSLRARISPPPVALPRGNIVAGKSGVRRFGDSYVLRRGKLWQVGLAGTPEQIGYAHTRLLYDEMVHNEGILLGRFREQVSFAPARWMLLDLAQLRYHDVDRGFSPERRREIAAGALGFQPDPFASLFPTFQRFVYLNALYDISLSFEHSPLIGCTTFVLSGVPQPGVQHHYLARAFDFEVDSVFDEHKAVFFVREAGKIPFVSVAWPGLVGVVSGMNAEGLALVVHGGRAGTTRTQGEPVVHALRRVLGTARTIDEAVAALAGATPLVSHIVIAADASGNFARIERVPGEPVFAARLPERAVVTNHFEGPARDDPKNDRVRQHTSTLPRRQRGDELVAALPPSIDASDAARLLRDRKAPGGAALPLGDRRAIDALIATHGVIFDTAERVLWVSESPHLLGRFVAFDLKRYLSNDYDPELPDSLPSIPADPLFTSGDYARWLAR